MKRRDLLTTTAGAAAALAMPNIAAAQGKKTIHFVPQSDLAILDPVFNTALVTRNHGFLVFDQLYGLDDGLLPQPQMVDGHVIEDERPHLEDDAARGHDLPRRRPRAGARTPSRPSPAGPRTTRSARTSWPSPTSCPPRPTA